MCRTWPRQLALVKPARLTGTPSSLNRGSDMKTITRTFDANGEQILSDPIPQDSLRNVWVGDTCTVYEQGDELPPEPGNADQ